MQREALFKVVLIAAALAACVRAPDDSADSGPTQQQGPPASDAGPPADAGPVSDPGPVAVVDGGVLSLDPLVELPVPPPPIPDDPAACTGILPHPDLDPQPARPCTEEYPEGTKTFRYDAGRLVYREVHTSYGYDEVYTSEDHSDLRVETLAIHGQPSTRDVTQLEDGRPAEADRYRAASDGTLQLNGHTTWIYDGSGRQQYAISQFVESTRVIERNVYDSAGRPYFVDRSQHWPGDTVIVAHHWTLRSWFVNGSLAHEIQTCGETGGAPCATTEKRWDACGNLTYSGNQTGNGRYSSFVDWSWDESGRPKARHDRWNTVTSFFNSVESYAPDGAGRPPSAAILTTNPPGYGSLPPTEQHSATYGYDEAGRVVDRRLDQESYNRTGFHARFDAAGRLLERTGYQGNLVGRWTYQGCGR